MILLISNFLELQYQKEITCIIKFLMFCGLIVNLLGIAISIMFGNFIITIKRGLTIILIYILALFSSTLKTKLINVQNE